MKKLIPLIISSTLLFANNSDDLSSTKQEINRLKKEQNQEEEKSNKYDWISDINLSGTISKDEDNVKSEDYSISISQDIFRFGGISSQIEYAKELKKLNDMDLNSSINSDLNSLYTLILDVKLNDIALNQNELNLKNSEITIRQKESEYKAGESGISDLNDAIIARNELQDTKKTLKLSKLTNLSSLKEYTKKDFNKIQIPDLKLISKEFYLEKSSTVNYSKTNINVNKELYNIEKSSYLPTIALTSNYGYSKSDKTASSDSYNYGVNISMPLSIKASSNIEQKRIDYLISKQELNDDINSASLTYDKALLTIQNYQERIELANNDIKLYDELLTLNKDEYNAGYKSLDDVETLENSINVRKLDIENYKLNIQKEILTLYFNLLWLKYI